LRRQLLKRLGAALHLYQQRIIARAELIEGESVPQLPKANSQVTDQNRMRIGKVFDIFGPVNHPYFIIRLNKGIDPTVQLGKKLYVEETSGRDNTWKK